MAKDINLNSEQWNDIVFERKNKNYGAYEMRMSSSKRLIIAFLIATAIVIFVSFLPALIETVANARSTTENISESSVLANLKELEEQVKEKDIIREESAPPEPPLKSTIQFTAPEIVDASEIKDDEEMKSQEDLAESKVQISVATIEGTDEERGIDIADLEQHKVIAEEKKEILEVVEQLPEFPGGEQALMKYLANNIKYPSIARETQIQGKVLVRFVVNKNGEVSDIQIVRSPHISLGNEAVRVVRAMPKWIPGRQNGKTVNVYFTLPVDFLLN